MSVSEAVLSPPSRRPLASSVRSIDGVRIFYDVYEANSSSLALIVPGFWRDRRHRSMQQMARLVNAAGFRAAVTDLRGHGESEGRFGFNRLEHYDLAAVAEKLLAEHRIDSIVLIGFSVGAAVAISTAARHELPLAGLLLISPVADMAMVRPRINFLTIHRHIAFSQALSTPRFDWGFASRDKLRAADEIRNVHAPLCLMHVKDDWLIDHRHSLLLYENANEPKELHLIDAPGNYHADRIFSVMGEHAEPIVSRFLSALAAK